MSFKRVGKEIKIGNKKTEVLLLPFLFFIIVFMLIDIKKKRLIFLASYILLACLFVYLIKPVYLFSIIIVLVPPTVLNFIWLKKSKTKIFIFSLLTTLLFAPPVEVVARMANAWDVQSILPRLLGIAPLENILFAFLNFFWVLSFYEYFVDRDKEEKISKNFKWIIALYLVLLVIVTLLFFLAPELVGLNYHTLSIIILLIPGALIFYKKPSLLYKTIIPTLFFAFVFFVYEIVSLFIGSWWWPGSYLFPLNLGGNIFPLDDVIIWYFLSTPVLIGGYEFFVDDNK
ncbi:MAG: hypothetical protein PWQ35_419 [Patescibacteria group bacterium]|nr:hypothetical protein [Patescibacteria group bacterium]